MKRWISMILALTMLLLICVACAKRQEPAIELNSETNGPAIDPNAGKRVIVTAPPESTISRPNVVLPGWPGFSVPADTVDVEVYLPNPAENTDWYYLMFEIWVALPEADIEEDVETQTVAVADNDGGATEEKVYAKLYGSGLVPPDQCLQYITLTQPVPAGVYDSFVHIQPYYIENSQPTSNCGNINIIFEAVKTDPAENR